MGEEAAAETPFLFFADWQGEIAQLTRDGRRKEFAGFSAFSTPKLRDRIPDPTDESTFTASKLNWQVINHAPRSAEFRALTRELLALRQREIVPLIAEGFASAKAELLGRGHSKEALNVVWRTDRNTSLQIITSFSERAVSMPTIEGSVLWNSERGASASLRPHQIVVAVDRRS
jgi:maltooligosyltrehalose trehalohydrolase